MDKGIIQTPAVDNGDGTYTATYTAANVAGTVKITALTTTGQFATATINLLEIHLLLSAPANQIEAGATVDLTLSVKDSKGNAVAGETVELTAGQGTVKLIDKGGGNYTAQYTAPEIGKNATITATTSSGWSRSISLRVLDVSRDKSSMKAVGKVALQTGEKGTVEVTVNSLSGKPVPRRNVILTADPDDKFAVQSSTETDTNGVATITFIAGKAGVKILKASVDGYDKRRGYDNVELAASLAFIFTGEEFDRSKWMGLFPGAGTFTDSGQSLGGSRSLGVAMGDMDNDSDLDTFIANSIPGNKVWVNDGSGTFTNSGQSLGSSASREVELGDVDNDGDLDAFVANFSNQSNKVWINGKVIDR